MNNEELQQSIFDSDAGSAMYEHKMAFDKLKDELAKFGLTSNQSKVYTYLGKYGSRTAPEVCKALKLPRTETYHLLTVLQNKGLVSATFQNPIRFSAEPLNKAIWVLVNAEKERINVLEKQETEIMKIWKSIPEYNETLETKDDKFQMLQSDNQTNSKIKKMIETAEDEFLVIGAEKDFLRFYRSDFFEEIDKKKTDMKLLTSISEKMKYIFDDIDRSKVRMMPSDIRQNLCFLIKDSNEMVFFMKKSNNTSEQMSAVWTDSEALIYSMKLLFDTLWTKSNKIHL
ncbi:Transcriptional regulator TrmB [Nitrosotalea sinensis]|uniref:Transcriptional regulator TrmB n=1 Tax=Nitrosotalea sinensis TaxID=1499975 RepID=A0A2H1EJ24_9ARCH|nr:helix-turn-helix domain-containing protein [Candidatus Nitrosotalea sinensis]SHO46752.1 Transcriptional regulator TrmB [Candidatus Nitrosotalea sinensis]